MNVAAGEQEPGVIGSELSVEPFGVGRGPDEDEESLGRDPGSLSRTGIGDRSRLQLPLTAQLNDLAVAAHHYGIVALDLIDQVPRHRFPQVVPANQQPAIGDVPGQEHRGLTSRIPTADDHHRVAGAELCLGLGCRVVDAAHLELLEPWHLESPVLGSGRDHHRTAPGDFARRELDRVLASVACQAHRCRRGGEADAELDRLQPGPLRELASGDAGGKAEVVLDPGRGPCLTTGGDCLDRLGVEALRSGVDGGGKTGGSGAHNDYVAQGRRRPFASNPDRSPHLGFSRVAKDLAAAGDDHGRLIGPDPEFVQQGVSVLVLLQVDPLVWHPVANEPFA